ncbi:hypothetical protein EVAR_23107_1 [Eumeta japonica]|uniref:Uncharacterized protein n=1 Tax=Eumeta variegata TaxID=151549 RepID=A0A4C1VMC2_EUMVA|nr:hypothetical protein EVAR_23107_1 [Eumeta japonica]
MLAFTSGSVCVDIKSVASLFIRSVISVSPDLILISFFIIGLNFYTTRGSDTTARSPAPRAPGAPAAAPSCRSGARATERAGEVYLNIPCLFAPPLPQRLAVSFIFRPPVLRSIPGY